MSYSHRFVSDLFIPTDQTNGSIDGHDAEYIDGIVCHAKLAMFCNELRAQTCFRGLKFALKSPSGDTIMNTIYAYYPNDIYVLGMIGYGDFSVNRESEPKFFVQSPNIANHKYSWHRSQFHRTMSKNVDKAVVNAKKFLRPYSAVAIADASVDSFEAEFGSVIYGRNRDVDRAREGIVSNIAGTIDVMRSVLNGEKPAIPEEVIEAYQNYFNVVGEYKENANDQFRIALVFTVSGDKFRMVTSNAVVSEDSAGRRYDIGRDIRNVIHSEDNELNTGKLFTADTLPEEVAGKLAMLSMVEQGEYISKVGFKFDERVCYVMVTA